MKGCIEQRSPGTWTIRYDLPPGPNGKRRQKRETFRGTKKAAQARLNEILQQLQAGTFIEPQKLSTAAYLRRWLAEYAKSHVSPATYEDYETIVEQHLIPAFGACPLDRLQPLHIQEHYTQALTRGRLDGRSGGLSPTTVRLHHRILRQALEQAVKWRLITFNPASAAEPPSATKKRFPVLTIEQTRTLRRLLEGHRLYLPMALSSATGMRLGELCALKWENVDFARGTITVAGSLESSRSAGLRLKEPKSEDSARTLVLPDWAIRILRQHKAQQAQERIDQGERYRYAGWVLAHADGSPHNPNRLSWQWRYIVCKLQKTHPDFPRIRFHDLRHGQASHLFELGEHPKAVSARLGHSTIGITMDLYGHLMPGMDAAAARKLSEALGDEDEGRRKAP